MNDEKEKMKELLIKNEGDIFVSTLDLYSYFVDKDYTETEVRLFQNIINKLRNENVNIFKSIKTKSFEEWKNEDDKNCYINTSILNIEDKDDVEYILRILTCILRAEIVDVIHKKASKEKRKRGIV